MSSRLEQTPKKQPLEGNSKKEGFREKILSWTPVKQAITQLANIVADPKKLRALALAGISTLTMGMSQADLSRLQTQTTPGIKAGIEALGSKLPSNQEELQRFQQARAKANEIGVGVYGKGGDEISRVKTISELTPDQQQTANKQREVLQAKKVAAEIAQTQQFMKGGVSMEVAVLEAAKDDTKNPHAVQTIETSKNNINEARQPKQQNISRPATAPSQPTNKPKPEQPPIQKPVIPSPIPSTPAPNVSPSPSPKPEPLPSPAPSSTPQVTPENRPDNSTPDQKEQRRINNAQDLLSSTLPYNVVAMGGNSQPELDVNIESAAEEVKQAIRAEGSLKDIQTLRAKIRSLLQIELDYKQDILKNINVRKLNERLNLNIDKIFDELNKNKPDRSTLRELVRETGEIMYHLRSESQKNSFERIASDERIPVAMGAGALGLLIGGFGMNAIRRAQEKKQKGLEEDQSSSTPETAIGPELPLQLALPQGLVNQLDELREKHKKFVTAESWSIINTAAKFGYEDQHTNFYLSEIDKIHHQRNWAAWERYNSLNGLDEELRKYIDQSVGAKYAYFSGSGEKISGKSDQLSLEIKDKLLRGHCYLLTLLELQTGVEVQKLIDAESEIQKELSGQVDSPEQNQNIREQFLKLNNTRDTQEFVSTFNTILDSLVAQWKNTAEGSQNGAQTQKYHAARYIAAMILNKDNLDRSISHDIPNRLIKTALQLYNQSSSLENQGLRSKAFYTEIKNPSVKSIYVGEAIVRALDALLENEPTKDTVIAKSQEITPPLPQTPLSPVQLTSNRVTSHTEPQTTDNFSSSTQTEKINLDELFSIAETPTPDSIETQGAAEQVIFPETKEESSDSMISRLAEADNIGSFSRLLDKTITQIVKKWEKTEEARGKTPAQQSIYAFRYILQSFIIGNEKKFLEQIITSAKKTFQTTLNSSDIDFNTVVENGHPAPYLASQLYKAIKQALDSYSLENASSQPNTLSPEIVPSVIPRKRITPDTSSPPKYYKKYENTPALEIVQPIEPRTRTTPDTSSLPEIPSPISSPAPEQAEAQRSTANSEYSSVFDTDPFLTSESESYLDHPETDTQKTTGTTPSPQSEPQTGQGVAQRTLSSLQTTLSRPPVAEPPSNNQEQKRLEAIETLKEAGLITQDGKKINLLDYSIEPASLDNIQNIINTKISRWEEDDFDIDLINIIWMIRATQLLGQTIPQDTIPEKIKNYLNKEKFVELCTQEKENLFSQDLTNRITKIINNIDQIFI